MGAMLGMQEDKALFAKGDKIQVWSASQKAWLDGTVEDVATTDGAKLRDSDGEVFVTERGTLYVSYGDNREKFIKPYQVTQLIRRPDLGGHGKTDAENEASVPPLSTSTRRVSVRAEEE